MAHLSTIRGPKTIADLESLGPTAVLSYIHHLESENARIWNEFNTMRDSVHIVAQGTLSELGKTVAKANTTFEALRRRMDTIVPASCSIEGSSQENKENLGFEKSLKGRKASFQTILGKRPSTPGSLAGSEGLYPPHPSENALRKLRSRSSSLGRTFPDPSTSSDKFPVHPNLSDFTFGSPVSAKTPERPVTGWPLAKAGHTPRVLHKRSKTFHEASTPNFSLPGLPKNHLTKLALATQQELLRTKGLAEDGK